MKRSYLKRAACGLLSGALAILSSAGFPGTFERAAIQSPGIVSIPAVSILPGAASPALLTPMPEMTSVAAQPISVRQDLAAQVQPLAQANSNPSLIRKILNGIFSNDRKPNVDTADGSPVAAEGAAAGLVPQDGSVKIIAQLHGATVPLTHDRHLEFVNTRQYFQVQQHIHGQLNAAGLRSDLLASFKTTYNAAPIATYQRINAVTFTVDASRADDFAKALRDRGYQVWANGRRKIITPVPVTPQDMDPQARNPVSMEEVLKITRADTVIKAFNEKWKGASGFIARSLIKLFGGGSIAQPAIAVIDSGADTTHPLLKNVKAVVNITDGENKDDIGHGSWVTSMVLNFVPWSRNLTHYKTFKDGGATTDDILKALTTAGNDGNLVISNSWGSDDGDPNSPDSQLVRKLAEEGHIMVFAAGNAGPGANTIGSPAIAYYRDAKTKALRILSIAAADRDKKIAYFSSRGPGSPITQNQPGYPHKPEATAVGYNVDGAWPAALGDADRADPSLGSLKAISGTSMSTPDMTGAIAELATVFGVTTVGPELDAIVNALMQTLEKTGQSPDLEGEGFLNVQAAHDILAKTMVPVSPSWALRLAKKVSA